MWLSATFTSLERTYSALNHQLARKTNPNSQYKQPSLTKINTEQNKTIRP